jgi:hypothetical protein
MLDVLKYVHYLGIFLLKKQQQWMFFHQNAMSIDKETRYILVVVVDYVRPPPQKKESHDCR